jgi:hypothetical protein
MKGISAEICILFFAFTVYQLCCNSESFALAQSAKKSGFLSEQSLAVQPEDGDDQLIG